VAPLALAGCAKGNHYAVRPADACAQLAASELPLMVFGSMASATEAVRHGNDTVIWRVFNDADDEMIRLAAHVAPDGEGSRIWTEVLPPAGAYHRRVEQGMDKVPSVVAFYRTVAEEQVASAMTGRDFNMAAITPAMMGATLAISRQIQQDAMHAASDAQARRPEPAPDSEDYAPADEGPDTSYGEPMDGSDS
jgi:hypothetical protein